MLFVDTYCAVCGDGKEIVHVFTIYALKFNFSIKITYDDLGISISYGIYSCGDDTMWFEPIFTILKRAITH